MTILTKKIRGTPMENPPLPKKKNKQKICRVTSYNWK